MKKINGKLLLEELKRLEKGDPSSLDKELFIEIFENPEPEKSGWQIYTNSEDWKFVSPAWEHGVLFAKTKDKLLLQINY